MPGGATPGRVPRQGGDLRLTRRRWWTLGSLDPTAVRALVTVIVRGGPSLPRAACIEHHELYDDVPGRPSHQQRHQAAVTVLLAVPGTGPVPESLH